MQPESFTATRYYTDIRIDGRTDVEAISEPVFTREDNTTIVSLIWDYRMDEARDGEFKVSITVSYSEDNEFTAIESYEMGFQKDDNDDDFISSGGWTGLVMIIIVGAICTAVLYKVVSKKKAKDKTK